MIPAHTIAERYLATWNEVDSDRRRQLLSSHWTSDATYVDPLAKAAGTGEIDALIGGVQSRFPGFRFALKNAPDGHGDHVRFAWTLGPEGEPAPIEGSDVVMTFHDRIACVIGFLDKVPAATRDDPPGAPPSRSDVRAGASGESS